MDVKLDTRTNRRIYRHTDPNRVIYTSKSDYPTSYKVLAISRIYGIRYPAKYVTSPTLVKAKIKQTPILLR